MRLEFELAQYQFSKSTHTHTVPLWLWQSKEHESLDFWIVGFTCKLYSQENPQRFSHKSMASMLTLSDGVSLASRPTSACMILTYSDHDHIIYIYIYMIYMSRLYDFTRFFWQPQTKDPRAIPFFEAVPGGAFGHEKGGHCVLDHVF